MLLQKFRLVWLNISKFSLDVDVSLDECLVEIGANRLVALALDFLFIYNKSYILLYYIFQ